MAVGVLDGREHLVDGVMRARPQLRLVRGAWSRCPAHGEPGGPAPDCRGGSSRVTRNMPLSAGRRRQLRARPFAHASTHPIFSGPTTTQAKLSANNVE